MTLIIYSKSTEKFKSDWNFDNEFLVEEISSVKTLQKLRSETDVIAIGGGTVIDTAKIIGKNPIIAIPTTLSGASMTNHSVYWDFRFNKNITSQRKKKYNISVPLPITVLKPHYMVGLEGEKLADTLADCLCQGVESMLSVNANDVTNFYVEQAFNLLKTNNLTIRNVLDKINASILIGFAMEKTGTNILHALSYAMYSINDVPHGKSLRYLLPKFIKYFRKNIPKKISNIDFRVMPVVENIYDDFDNGEIVDEALTYGKIQKTILKINRSILIDMMRLN